MYVEGSKVKKVNVIDGVSREVLAYDNSLMMAKVYFEKGAIGPNHSHPQEQITYILSGKIMYHEEGLEDKILTVGDSYYVASNVVHGLEALEDTVLLDVFTPQRDDFFK